MAHPPEKRLELRAAYIGGLPLEAAAEKAGVPYATARNWFNLARRDGEDWDKFRAANLIRADLDWLSELGLVKWNGEIAQCTERGRDVAALRAKFPGEA